MDKGRNNLFERPIVNLIVRVGRKGNINRVSFPFSFSDLIFKTGAWKEGVTRFVERDGQDLRGVVESLLDSICMMGIDVDVGDLLALAEKLQDSDDRVIDITESRSP